MTDEQHEAWIKVALVVALLAGAVGLAFAHYEDGAWLCGTGIVLILIGG